MAAKEDTGHRPNSLIRETSPYLLQHAYNPVDWHPWGKEALEKAATENKLIVVSIGYSSCHWCHVMERESFEDPEVARLMNDRFVSIKVDREERPDIDNIYMAAVQIMNMRGGWPLNCIALPDGRPVWGGTYLPKDQWLHTLQQVADYHTDHRDRMEQYAAELAEGIRSSSLFQAGDTAYPGTRSDLLSAAKALSAKFDPEYGGMSGAPKFPMPVMLEFLLQAGVQTGTRELLDQAEKTLLKMDRGGIFDQVGGGFARYSVDHQWKVPHFEKMLYDNAQLLGLYSKALQVFGHREFRDVIDATAGFLNREMRGEHGLYYSALDADSEGEEGRYYVWRKEELQNLLKGDFDVFADYYSINQTGHWEEGKYILYRTMDSEGYARSIKMDPEAFRKRLKSWNDQLLRARETRVRPGLDDKSLTSWNALTVSGFVSAFKATGHEPYLEDALQCARAIRQHLWDESKILYRNFKDGRRTIPGFLPDYAFFTAACLDLFEVTADSAWFGLADALMEVTWLRFHDPHSEMFYFNASDEEVHISNQTETQDNVIPSSNAVAAMNLFRLGHLRGDPETMNRAAALSEKMTPMVERYPSGFGAWGQLMLKQAYPFHEIAVTGPEAVKRLREISREYLPGAILAGAESEGDLPLFRKRFLEGKTRIFVCRDQVCERPVETTEDAKNIYHQA